MVRVFPLCMRRPFTSSHMSSACGSPTSSAVTSQGPTGPKVGQVRRQVPHLAILVDHTGFFLSNCAEPHELHEASKSKH